MNDLTARQMESVLGFALSHEQWAAVSSDLAFTYVNSEDDPRNSKK